MRIFLLSIMSLLLHASVSYADMGDIDLEVRDLIAAHLNVNPDDVHSLKFINSAKECLFVVQAKASQSTCDVCFQGTFQSFYASSVICN